MPASDPEDTSDLYKEDEPLTVLVRQDGTITAEEVATLRLVPYMRKSQWTKSVEAQARFVSVSRAKHQSCC